MALQVGRDGEMQVRLTAKDDASPVLEDFARNAKGSMDKAGGAARISNRELSETAVVGGRLAIAATTIAATAMAAAGAIALLVKNTADTADQMGKLSQRLGVSTEFLSALKFSGDLADISLTSLAGSMRFLSKAMSDTQAGTGEAREAFRALRIDVTDATGKLKASDQVMFEVADRFASMEDGAGKTALAVRLFGRAGAELIPLLNQGSRGLREQADEARRLGLVISDEAARSAEKFNDDLTRLKATAQGAALQFGLGLLPAVSDFTAALVRSISTGVTWVEFGEKAGQVLRDVAGLSVKVAASIDIIGKSIGGAAAAAVAAAKLEFSEARAIITEVMEDTRRIGEEARRRAEEVAKPMDLGLEFGITFETKGEAPALRSREQIEAEKQAAAERKRLQDEDTRGWIAYIDNQVAEYERGLAMEAQLTEQFYADRKRLQDLDDRGWIALIEQQTRDYEEEQRAQLQIAKERQQLEQEGWQIFAASLISLMGSKSRILFQIGKAAAIATAIIDTYVAANKTLASLPWPWNIAAAAAVAAAGLVRVQQIKATEFNGGAITATPVFAANPVTSLPTSTALPSSGLNPFASQRGTPAPPARQVNLTLVGQVFTAAFIRDELIPQLNDAAGDGVNILVRAA